MRAFCPAKTQLAVPFLVLFTKLRQRGPQLGGARLCACGCPRLLMHTEGFVSVLLGPTLRGSLWQLEQGSSAAAGAGQCKVWALLLSLPSPPAQERGHASCPFNEGCKLGTFSQLPALLAGWIWGSLHTALRWRGRCCTEQQMIFYILWSCSRPSLCAV